MMSTLDPHLALRGCDLCAAGLEHCHGTAIAHRSGGIECSDDPACAIPEAAHAQRVSCAEIDDHGC